MRTLRTRTAASVAVAVALLALAVSSVTALVALTRSAGHITAVRTNAVAYIALKDAVGAEAFAEAGYRRAPSPDARQRLERAIREVDVAVDDVRAVGGRRDGATLSYVQMLNRRYSTEVRETLDRPRASNVDDRVAGPALDAISRVLESAYQARRAEITRATARQSELVRRFSVLLPTVFGLAFGLLGRTWWLMRREQQRLVVEAARHRRRALTDGLTGLPNRDALNDAMDDALGRPRTEAALLYLDLDRFKPVNDRLGHHAGDAVLVEVAHRLRDAIRAGEVAARIGGDEFAVFLPRGRDAVLVAERILDALAVPFVVEGNVCDVGASIGLARHPRDGHTATALLRAADAALYDAKHAARGTLAESNGQVGVRN